MAFYKYATKTILIILILKKKTFLCLSIVKFVEFHFITVKIYILVSPETKYSAFKNIFDTELKTQKNHHDKRKKFSKYITS